jgi:hypothetical protein
MVRVAIGSAIHHFLNEGTVQAFDAEGQVYHVTYEDGEQHEHVLPHHIRAML